MGFHVVIKVYFKTFNTLMSVFDCEAVGTATFFHYLYTHYYIKYQLILFTMYKNIFSYGSLSELIQLPL